MVEIEITPLAVQDVKNILDHVYKDSVQNAEKLHKQLIEKIASLKVFPERGNLVKELSNPQLRELKLYHLQRKALNK